MKGKIKRFLFVAIAIISIFCIMAFAGCSSNISFYIDSDGVLWEDNGKEITNLGKVTGDGISAEELYEFYLSQEGNEGKTYDDFLSEYMTLETAADNSKAINSALRSAVKVYTEFPFTISTGGGFFGGGSTVEYRMLVSGSGIVYDTTSDEQYIYFLTNYHVVYYYETTGYGQSQTYSGLSDNIHVYLYGSEDDPVASAGSYGYTTKYSYGDYGIQCEYVGGSAEADIAVIRAKREDVYAVNPSVSAVEFAECDEYGEYFHVGETAITIGNAEDYGLSVTEGIISVDSEYIYLSVDGTYRYHRSIRIDTAMYSGNSGGGLFNKYGQLIGIVNAGDSTNQNMNYAIPLTVVKGTADNIIYYAMQGDTSGCAYVMTMGLSIASENSRYIYDTDMGYGRIAEDSTISSVTKGSIADDMGLKEGDIIREFVINEESYQINRIFNVSELLLTVREGDMLTFVIERSGEEQDSHQFLVREEDLAAKE